MHIKLRQHGDTIVEVLLAMLIVSSVLGGAYVSANRSSNTNRQSQERGEALKLVEAQLEKLKVFITKQPLPAEGTIFCIDNPTSVHVLEASCPTSGAANYKTTIKRAASPNENNYTITSQWDRVGGGATKEQIKMTYRVYP